MRLYLSLWLIETGKYVFNYLFIFFLYVCKILQIHLLPLSNTITVTIIDKGLIISRTRVTLWYLYKLKYLFHLWWKIDYIHVIKWIRQRNSNAQKTKPTNEWIIRQLLTKFPSIIYITLNAYVVKISITC